MKKKFFSVAAILTLAAVFSLNINSDGGNISTENVKAYAHTPDWMCCNDLVNTCRWEGDDFECLGDWVDVSPERPGV